MSDYEILDDRFAALIIGHARLEKLWTGCRWAEGPVYVPAAKSVLWSDIPNDRLMRFDETDGSVSVFESPCGYHNGHTLDRAGRVIACEHGGRRVTRLEPDGRWSVLADGHDGRRLNSPNDVVVKSDGSIWFTDPTYGIDSEYEGDAAPSEIGASYVYRLPARGGKLQAVATDFVKPNGLAFSPDESRLYIVDTGATHVENGPRHIRVFDVGEDGITLSGGKVFATSPAGLFDGLRVDIHGNVWTSSGEGVICYAPDGTLLGKVLIPEVVANVEFGGPKRNRLYICGTTSLYAVYLNTQGAKRPKK